MTDDVRHEYRRFLSDHPGNPLGKGYPLGRALRIEFRSPGKRSWRGESHYQWWMRVVRSDPCAYCGAVIHMGSGSNRRDVGWWGSGTVDHVEPQSRPVAGLGGAHSHMNVVGACDSCNCSKSDRHLLLWLLSRRR